jgi:uncharacterized damage-inducible protein DinB
MAFAGSRAGRDRDATLRVMIQDTINHWAHHRGQMTVYLRLLGAKVPALYGPSKAHHTRIESVYHSLPPPTVAKIFFRHYP